MISEPALSFFAGKPTDAYFKIQEEIDSFLLYYMEA